MFKKYSEGRIKEGKKSIDLYLWFENRDEGYIRFLYKDNDSKNVKKLKELFEG